MKNITDMNMKMMDDHELEEVTGGRFELLENLKDKFMKITKNDGEENISLDGGASIFGNAADSLFELGLDFGRDEMNL